MLHGASHAAWITGKMLTVDVILLVWLGLFLLLSFLLDETDNQIVLLASMLGFILFLLLPILAIVFLINY